jgi:uncharacterized membrane protein YeiB
MRSKPLPPATLISVAIFIGFSWSTRAWLRRNAQVPMEALWRRLSYR